MPGWLGKCSGAVQKKVKDLVAECVWMQLTRRAMPHEPDSTEFVERRFGDDIVRNQDDVLSLVMNFKMGNSVSAQQELKALSGIVDKNSSTRAGEEELARNATIRDIYDSGFCLPLSDLKVHEDGKQMIHGALKPYVTNVVQKGQREPNRTTNGVTCV